MTEAFDLSGTLRRLRLMVTHSPTQAEQIEHAASWWQSLHAELVSARRDFDYVSPQDVDHAHLMSCWAQHDARLTAWQADSANLRAEEFWRANKPADEGLEREAWNAIPIEVRTRLHGRPRAPDRRTPPLPECPESAPSHWPAIEEGVTWSEYLVQLLNVLEAE